MRRVESCLIHFQFTIGIHTSIPYTLLKYSTCWTLVLSLSSTHLLTTAVLYLFVSSFYDLRAVKYTALANVKKMRELLKDEIDVVGVGGVFSGEGESRLVHYHSCTGNVSIW